VKSSSRYGERDYAFGQAMLTLRTSISLTQAGLAEHLGVSRRAVAEWEAGLSYPKAEHLKQLIALGVELQAFAVGREVEEIRALWKAARQKLLLDEHWLHELLGKQRPTLSLVAPQPIQEPRANEQAMARPALERRVDWGEALAVPSFYDREREVATLTQWVVQERCRVVSVLGMGGIGKSALAVSLMHHIAAHFAVVLWRSLRDAPACEELLEDCQQVLSLQPLREVPASLERRLGLLLESLREERVLLVLDNLEMLLAEGEGTGRMRAGYEDYERLLRQVAQTEHQSCLLLTSREKPRELVALEGSRTPVRSLRLDGLDAVASAQLLAEREVVGLTPDRERLIELYAGNPLALKIVAQTIVDLFGSEIAPFLEQGEVVFGGVRELLAEQFARLSAVEQTVLLWLAILREPVSIEDLLAMLVTPLSRAQVLDAVEALRRRSLIERGKRQGSFTLQSVVLEYATDRLIVEIASEIEQGRLSRLVEYGLELATAKEYVRQIQQSLIVAPLLAQLRKKYSQRTALGGAVVRAAGPVACPGRLCAGLRTDQRAGAGGIWVAWICPSLSFEGRICKGSRCRIPRLPGRRSRIASLPRPSMPSSRSPSAAPSSTGPRAASGEKYGCGAREARPCTWPGRRIRTLWLPSPSAQTNARWPAGALMAASSSGTSNVVPCSGQAGIPMSPAGWLFPPTAACSPVAHMMAPSGSGIRSWASPCRTCRIPVRSSRWLGTRMGACSPLVTSRAQFGCGRGSRAGRLAACRRSLRIAAGCMD